MPSRLPKHLHDALTAARLATGFVAGLDDAGYLANVLVRSAVERQLETLGEARRRALEHEPALREQIPETALAVALRNRIIHGHDRVEHAIEPASLDVKRLRHIDAAQGQPAGGGFRALAIGRGAHGYVALYEYLPALDCVVVVALKAQREAGYTDF